MPIDIRKLIDLTGVRGNIIPDTDDAYDIGSSGFNWKDLYLSGDTNVRGQVKAANPSGMNFLPHPSNPLFGDDEAFISVFKDGSTWRAYGGIGSMYYWTSTDGITDWSAATQITNLNANGVAMAWKETGGPSIDGTAGPYYMLYRYSSSGVVGIGLAISTDGTTWTQSTDNPVMQADEGEWDNGSNYNCIEDCEDAWDEQVVGNVTASLDASDYKVGSGSAKFVVDAAFGTGVIGSEVISEDLTGSTLVKAWVKSSVTLAEGDWQLLLDDTADCASPLETIDVPALVANTWTRVTFTLSTPASLGSLISIGLNQAVDKGAMSFWIDEVTTGGPNSVIDACAPIKIGNTYYIYYNTVASRGNYGRELGIATSTDLINWTKDSNNPTFSDSDYNKGGWFCPTIWKIGDWYYFAISRYINARSTTTGVEFELYADTSPTFYSSAREFLGVIDTTVNAATWEDDSHDTPWVVTDNIYRNTFNDTDGQVWMYYEGRDSGNVRDTGLLIQSAYGNKWQGPVDANSQKLVNLAEIESDSLTIDATTLILDATTVSLANETLYFDIGGELITSVNVNGVLDIESRSDIQLHLDSNSNDVSSEFKIYHNSTGASLGSLLFEVDNVGFTTVYNRLGIGRDPNSAVHVHAYEETGNCDIWVETDSATHRSALCLRNDQNDRTGFFFYGSAYATTKYRESLRIHLDAGADNLFFTGMDGTYWESGNVYIVSDSLVLGFGANSLTAPDATIGFDGNSLNIVANAVTATDDLEITADYIKLFAGSDIDDYVEIFTSGDQPNINFNGCDGKITASGGTVDFDDESLTTSGTGTFTAGVTADLLEKAGTTSVLSIQPDAIGDGSDVGSFRSGYGLKFFENADAYTSHGHADNENPVMAFYGGSSTGQVYGTVGIDDWARLVFGGTAVQTVFDNNLTCAGGEFQMGDSNTGFMFVNTGSGAGNRHITFGAKIDDNDDPVWVMTDRDYKNSNFGVNSAIPQLWLHDGSATLTNLLKLYHDGTDGNVEAVAGDLNLKAASNTTIGDGGTTNYVEISPTGDQTFVGSAGLPFAEIYANDVADELTITTAGQANKVQITSFAVDGVSNNTTPDHTDDHVTVVKAGMYLCTVSMSISSAAAGGADDIGFAVYKNNGATEFANCHGHRTLSGGGTDRGSCSMSGIIDLAASDTIEVWIWNEDSTDNVVVDDITLSLCEIGGT